MFCAGVVIDDLVMLERILVSSVGEKTVSDRRMELVEAAYAEAGLRTNPKKAFYKSSAASFWGVSVDGVKGTMRPNPQRLCPLKLITWRVVSLGVVTVSLLESLVGSWVSIFMQRQRLLCTLDLSFKAIHCGASGEQVLRMSPSLKDELISCCILGTMTVCNLRAKTLGVIKATDASDWGMASVEAALPVAVARKASRFALSKSVWTKLLPPSKAWLKMKQLMTADEELPGDEVFDTHPFWALLANFPPYKELWRKPYERSCHINIGEMTAHLKEEARVLSQYSSSRCCYALDSQVALGALVKGRSSSCGLNSLLKRSLAIQLGYDLYSNFGIFPSAINRADGPTRGTQPAAPSVSGPPFWRTLSRGQYEDFERWLADRGLRESEAAIHEEFVPLGARQRHDVPAGGLSVGGEKKKCVVQKLELDRCRNFLKKLNKL